MQLNTGETNNIFYCCIIRTKASLMLMSEGVPAAPA